MDLSNMVKFAAGGVILFAVGAGMGYYYAPDKIKKESSTTTEKEKIVEEETNTKYDPVTGKKTEETTKKKTTDSDTKKKEKSTEREKTRKMWAAKVGIVQSLNKAEKPTYRVGGEVRLPIFDSWVGAEADIDVSEPKLGAYLRVEF